MKKIWDSLKNRFIKYKEIKYDSINKPSLFLFRESNIDVINKLDYKCNIVEINGLDGYACIVK